MATLTGSTIAASYLTLLKLTSAALGSAASAKYIEDAAGTDSALSLSTTRVGINTSAPASLLHISKDDGNSELTLSAHSDTEGYAGYLTFKKSDNTEASPQLVDDDAIIGGLSFQGYTNGWVEGALIKAQISGTPSTGSNDLPTELTFHTMPDGSDAIAQRMVILPDGNVGIGTATAPHGGVGYAKLAIDGTNGSAAGPHVQYTTAADDYPLFQQLNWTHDNIQLFFDAYYDGADKSSDAGSNYSIIKNSDLLKFRYDSSISAGSAVTWNDGIVLNTTGNVGIGDSDPSDAKLSIDSVASGDYGLKVVQAQNEPGIYVDQNGTSNAIQIENTGNPNRGLFVYSDEDGASAEPLVQIWADHDAFDQSALYINNDGTSNALRIDNASTATGAISIDTCKYGMYALQTISGGYGLYIDRNIAEAGSAPLVTFRNDHASNTQPTLMIDHDGTAGNAMSIDLESTSGSALEVEAPATTDGTTLMVYSADALTTGGLLYLETGSTNLATTAAGGVVEVIHTGNSSTNDNNLLFVVNDHASSSGTVCQRIQQDAASYCLLLDQNGNNTALYIDSEQTSTYHIHMPAPVTTTGQIIAITDANALTSGSMLYLESNSSSNTARNLVKIVNDNAATDNAVGLHIQQDGNGAAIELSGAGNCGIKFPATVGPSSDANTLDDYEEGTWTPANAAQALQTGEGRYVKVGAQVTCYFGILSHASNTASGDMSGLPFTLANEDGASNGVGFVGYQNSESGETWNIIADKNTVTWSFRVADTQKQPVANKNITGVITYTLG